MKKLKLIFVIVVGALLTMGMGSVAYAFHSGGVAECGGCHSMHAPKAGGTFLLLGIDQSSTCLNCHQHAGDTGPSSYHVSTAEADMPAGSPPLQQDPGGDFGWLKKTYTYTIRGTATTEDGQTHGHNIIAADFNYVQDTDFTTAPGGTYPSSQLACTSCHDPHGQSRILPNGTYSRTGGAIIGSGSYASSPDPSTLQPGQAIGVYRLLWGSGAVVDGVTFTNFVSAVAPDSYNRSEASTQTRVAYGLGWGTWCSTCHPDIHSTPPYTHPVDQALGSTVAEIYGEYVKSGDLTGTPSQSYLSLVPFAQNTTVFADLAANAVSDNSKLSGPTADAQVMCLSCHRPHASGWENALRWNMEGEFMVYNSQWPGIDTTPTVPQFARGRTSQETQAAYYQRAPTLFASYQRVLCNKCHAKD
jgi:predicted CXXCH cytochrome family protein